MSTTEGVAGIGQRVNFEFQSLFKLTEKYYFTKIGKCLAIVDKKNKSVQVVLGPHFPGVLAALGVLIMGSFTFDIIRRKNNFSVIHLFISIYLSIHTGIFLLIVALRDPGILLNSEVRDDDVGDIQPYCDICEVYQPDGTVHCESCDCCIEKLDHHCPWVGKCIGKKNKLPYVIFMGSWIIYLLYFLAIASSELF